MICCSLAKPRIEKRSQSAFVRLSQALNSLQQDKTVKASREDTLGAIRHSSGFHSVAMTCTCCARHSTTDPRTMNGYDNIRYHAIKDGCSISKTMCFRSYVNNQRHPKSILA